MSRFLKTSIIVISELAILLGCTNTILKSKGSSLDEAFGGLKENSSRIIDIASSTLKNKNPDEYLNGAGISFDSEFYPYYGSLPENVKQLYKQIYVNICECESELVPITTVSVDEADMAMQAVILDHPELFWIGTGYSCTYTSSSKCLGISFEFLFSKEDIPVAKQQFDSKVNEIILGAVQYEDAYSKEKYVHDAILDLVEYNGIDLFAGQNAYSALVNRSSVCAGYSRAFQCIMVKLGIPTYYCMGTAEGDHAWNIIKLSDGFYNVDLTWDDACGNRYEYFNRSDDVFSVTHLRDAESTVLPACNGSIWSGPQTSAVAQIPYIGYYPTPEPPEYIEVY